MYAIRSYYAPGVVRQQDLYQQQIVKQNEQSMSLKVIDLPDGEASYNFV